MQITSFTIVYSTVYSGRSKKTPKLCVTGLCVGNSLVTGEFPTQRANNMENVPIWWCHHIQTTKTVIISLYLQATWSKNDISLVHEISFIYLNFFIIETEKSGYQCDHDHGWPSTQPGTCTQPCPIVDTAVPPLLTQPCPGRTMSTAVCIYVAGLCASCPAV